MNYDMRYILSQPINYFRLYMINCGTLTQVRICRVPEFSTNDVLKMKDVEMTMCTA